MHNNDLKKDRQDISDEQLAKAAAQGDASALTILTVRYMPMVRSRAAGYFSDGYEFEDLAQEGMIGLLKAIRGFSPEKGASFHTFALLCIDRNIISAVRLSLSSKRIPPSSLLYIDQSDGHQTDMGELLFEHEQSPEDMLINKDTVERIYSELERLLSKVELKVFKLYLKGYTYETIADRLNMSKKAVDNAVCRAKNKLKNYR